MAYPIPIAKAPVMLIACRRASCQALSRLGGARVRGWTETDFAGPSVVG
jgi:hypothetical protein